MVAPVARTARERQLEQDGQHDSRIGHALTPEPFGLSWPGKAEAVRAAGSPARGTLVPAPGEGVDEATTGHLFIEGDNLDVLKLLQETHDGRVKLIYIDPPYNTGNAFVYPDDFSESADAYFRRGGVSDIGDIHDA